MVMTESAITVRSNIPLMHVLILLTLGFLGMLRDILLFPPVTVKNDGEAHNTDPNQAIHRRVSELGSKKQLFLVHVSILLTLRFLGLLRNILLFPSVPVENDGEAENTDPKQAVRRRALELGSKKQHSALTYFLFADFELSRCVA
jgi:hypothetical protein